MLPEPLYEELIEEPSTALVEHHTAEVVVDRMPQMIAPDAMPDLDAMEQGISLQAKYIEFETKGECVRGVFLGYTSMKNQQGNQIPVANFQNKDGIWVNAGANLVSQLRNVPENTPLAITYLGKEDTKRGNKVKTFEVRILNAPRHAQEHPAQPVTQKDETQTAQPTNASGRKPDPATAYYIRAGELNVSKQSAAKILNAHKNDLGGYDWKAATQELEAV